MTWPSTNPAAADFVAFLTEEDRGQRAAAAAADSMSAAGSSGEVSFRHWTKRIARGDEQAFTDFYERYHRRIYKYLLVLARGNEPDAREVMQLVVLKAAGGFKIFAEESQLWAWLCRISRNAYVDLLRRHSRDSRFVPLDEIAPNVSSVPLECDRLAMAMAQAMAGLAERDQELVRCAYIDKRPLQHLANESGLSYKAIESRLGRLRSKLKAAILRFLDDEENN